VTTPDDVLARDLAVAAGQLLLARRAEGGEPSQLKDDGDRLSHEFLTAELARLRPDDAVLSEEGQDDSERLSARRVWIVDPLDGTREFGEAGRTDWAVHVALWADGELVAGAVALPAQDRVLSTADPIPSPGPLGDPLRLLVSRSRPPEFVRQLGDRVGGVLVPLGSAGAKAAAVISGQADAYVHSGGQYEWDSAAPVAVAVSAGLHTSRIDGSKLAYNQASPSLPDILICRAEIATLLLDNIGSLTAGASLGATTSPAHPEHS
jgi:3'(2'), 5'-bisphosphate nucleotidase